MKTLVVFSQLRWDFVYQRPQHLMSRLAKRWNIIFIEEPIPGADSDLIEKFPSAAPGVDVWRPHLRGMEHGFHPAHKDVLRRLVARQISLENVRDYWVWFYTPMALPIIEWMEPRGIIYDCMDELSAFGGAAPELVQLETELLRAADVVFTGGRSLYSAKRNRHHNIHCFPSSVDAQHFKPGAPDHPLQRELPHPRLGYCGVIDERIDLSIVAGIADSRPNWEIVLVGPTAKIDPASLPQRPNIHWLGQQPYRDLPAFISGWDVCLLPFALNDSTRFISPTKTLEYMACGKPSISTAIRDVVEPYRHVVAIQSDAPGFVAACDELLGRTAAQVRVHGFAQADIIRRTSWDTTAEAMSKLILQAQAARQPHQQRGMFDVPARLAHALGSAVSAASTVSAKPTS